ncbi:uncharacterized protein LOC131616412 isoform X2 [Vicia villosa]|uniref:uncharacterized protein LOC131616412 isoform X2 n=1 Tax=Vicia villosa TaxID=3911 RepID=UPI00273CB365|nr:uncharacterized protein LOC131616412 isoform X2 [Vicia villosa]
MAALKFLLFLTAAIALLFLLSHSPQNNHLHHCLEPHSEWDDDFNFTNNIVCLFPQIDIDPTDHYVSVDELAHWKLHHHQTNQFHRTKKEMIIYDNNHDGFLSFTEFQYRLSTPPQYAGADDSFGYDMRLLEEDHFNASDTDGDGRLNLSEFNDFLHPADSNNQKLQQWLSREEVWERDTDRDGKVSYIEFVNGLFVTIRSYDEESYGYSHHYDDSKNVYAEFMFSQLDKDGDGYLSAIELLPIIGKVHPSWRYYARKQAEYFVSQAQVGKYGHLNLNEMIKNADILYAAIFRDEFY